MITMTPTASSVPHLAQDAYWPDLEDPSDGPSSHRKRWSLTEAIPLPAFSDSLARVPPGPYPLGSGKAILKRRQHSLSSHPHDLFRGKSAVCASLRPGQASYPPAPAQRCLQPASGQDRTSDAHSGRRLETRLASSRRGWPSLSPKALRHKAANHDQLGSRSRRQMRPKADIRALSVPLGDTDS